MPQANKPAPHDTLAALQAHHGDSWGWALGCCNWDRPQAEDVLQEAYLRVLDGRADFAGRSSAKTWFFGVIKRIAAEQHRVQKRRKGLSLRHLLLPEETMQNDRAYSDIEQSEATHSLRDALQSLSPKQREVLHLVFYAELTLEETAETLQLTIGSVRTHYHRGKQQLFRKLDIRHD